MNLEGSVEESDFPFTNFWIVFLESCWFGGADQALLFSIHLFNISRKSGQTVLPMGRLVVLLECAWRMCSSRRLRLSRFVALISRG